MLRYLKYVFPAGVQNAIALTQNVAANGSVIFNGGFANAAGIIDFLSQGYSRQISITSGLNVHVNFTITGTQNNVPITEILAGPNVATVYSAQVYDTITSITVDGDAVGFEIGTGWRGYFRIIELDLFRNVVTYSLSLGTGTNGNNIPTAVYSTLDNIVNSTNALNNVPRILSDNLYDHIIPNNYSVFVIKALAATSQYSLQYPYTDLAHSTAGAAPAIPFLTKYLLVELGSDATSINNSMTLIFTQL